MVFCGARCAYVSDIDSLTFRRQVPKYKKTKNVAGDVK